MERKSGLEGSIWIRLINLHQYVVLNIFWYGFFERPLVIYA